MSFKSELKEFCQSKKWPLPEYAVAKEGPDHLPSYAAVVDVNGIFFASQESCRRIKDAQNSAAKHAIRHFAGSSSSAQNPESPRTFPALAADGANRVMITENNNTVEDMVHLPKTQLIMYTQKRNLPLPVYNIERMGPLHASLFRSHVTVNGKIYQSEEDFRTVKEAETAAARVALAWLFPTGIQEVDPCLYKNLLQALVQKEHSCLPKYSVTRAVFAHKPVFVAAVEVRGEIFAGREAETKKRAEMNAAKVAYTVLKKRYEATPKPLLTKRPGATTAAGINSDHDNGSDNKRKRIM